MRYLKRKKGRLQRMSGKRRRNFLERLPEELLRRVLEATSSKDLFLGVQRTSKYLFNMAAIEHDTAMWKQRCDQLWDGKFRGSYDTLDEELPWRLKYVDSIRNSSRCKITPKELTSFLWAFRFKPSAGQFWQNLDPYYRNGMPMLRVFSGDGNVAVPPIKYMSQLNDEATRGATAYEDDRLEHLMRQNGMTVQWNIRKSRYGRRGCFVQINRWPSMGIDRLADSWGWVLSNQWVVYCTPPEAMRDLDHLDSDIDRWLR